MFYRSPKNIVNMNYITFDEPIGLFANYFMFYFHFLSYFKQLSLVARGKTHTTKSARASQLIILHCKNSGVKFNTPGVVRGLHQVGVNFNTSRC